MNRILTIPLALLALALSPLAVSAAGVTTSVYSSQEASNEKETGINESCKDVRIDGDYIRAKCNFLHSYDGGTIVTHKAYISTVGRLECLVPGYRQVTLRLNNPDGLHRAGWQVRNAHVRLSSDGRRYILEADCTIPAAHTRTRTLQLWHYLRNGSGNLRWRH